MLLEGFVGDPDAASPLARVARALVRRQRDLAAQIALARMDVPVAWAQAPFLTTACIAGILAPTETMKALIAACAATETPDHVAWYAELTRYLEGEIEKSPAFPPTFRVHSPDWTKTPGLVLFRNSFDFVHALDADTRWVAVVLAAASLSLTKPWVGDGASVAIRVAVPCPSREALAALLAARTVVT